LLFLTFQQSFKALNFFRPVKHKRSQAELTTGIPIILPGALKGFLIEQAKKSKTPREEAIIDCA